MASTTGIEIGSDACILAGVRPGPGNAVDVRALSLMSGSEWPSNDWARTSLLRSIRRDEGLPRRAVVVAWEAAEAVDHASARASLRFIEDAGFTIESIVSPPQALAELAGTRRRLGSSEATVWTALNTDGAAIAIIAGGELLFARTFRWTYKRGLTVTRAQLLQRYTLVAHLAPEVRHGIETVRASHGVGVDGVVTCGNLPDLRSLTMPLIEELDLEVETLDGIDGLRASARVSPGQLLEAAPAIRLACAAASAPAPQTGPRILDGVTFMQEEPSAVVRVGAAVALIGALVWGAVSFRTLWQPLPVKPVTQGPRHAAAPQPQQPRPSEPSNPGRGETPVAELKNDSTPVSTVLSVRPDQKTTPAPPTAAPRSPSVSTSSSRVARPAPLTEPLPRVDSILIDQERRLAVIDGAVVSVGDAVGRRTVAGIERDAVLLREPSGLIVRVR
jgi:hypothetical protein